MKKKILNLYAGIGGNRKLWGNEYEITAVELDNETANVYKDYFPNDNVIVTDAHEYLLNNYDKYDFIYMHVKKTDSYGEDGNFGAKAKVIEEFDSFVPDIMALNPDVLVVTGDHSTPASMKAHSWHPVPIMISSKYARGVGAAGFGETECVRGELGTFRAVDLMTMILAHAGRLQKFGA